jgi:hypothetical protein
MRHRFRPLTNPAGPAVVGIVSGLLLAVAVFLPWYSTNLGAPASPESASGWAGTAIAKGVLVLGIVWALASALLLADHLDAYRIDSRTAEALGWLVAGTALVAAGLVVFRLFQPPEPADFLTRDFGLFLSLVAAALGVAAGFAQAAQR